MGDATTTTDSKWPVLRENWRVLMPPESQDKWKVVCNSVLQETEALTRNMRVQLQDHDAVEAASPKNFSRKLAKSVGALHRKPGGAITTNVGPRVMSSLHTNLDVCRICLEGLDHRLQEVRECLLRAQHAQRAKWASLKVCEWRLELRSKRPPQEVFRDHFQQALEHERDVLQRSRKELGDLSDEVTKVLQELEGVRYKVNKRFQELSRPSGAGPLAPPPPSSPGGGTPEPPETQEQLVKRASKLSETTAQVMIKTDATVLRTGKECAAANQKVSTALAKRASEVGDLKSRLEEQLRETDNAIASGEASMLRSKTRCIDVGMDGTLKDKVEATGAMLERLKESRRSLEEELRCKLIAFKIDDQCRRISPQMTPSHKQPKSRDYGSLLMRMSAPNLLLEGDSPGSPGSPTSPYSAASNRPISPAGVSAALKAAAASTMST